MSKVTLVIDCEDGKEPVLYAYQKILGGKLIGFAWYDLQEKIEELENKIKQLEQGNE